MQKRVRAMRHMSLLSSFTWKTRVLVTILTSLCFGSMIYARKRFDESVSAVSLTTYEEDVMIDKSRNVSATTTTTFFNGTDLMLVPQVEPPPSPLAIYQYLRTHTSSIRNTAKFNAIGSVLTNLGFQKMDNEIDSVPPRDDVYLWLTNNHVPTGLIREGKQLINGMGMEHSQCIGGPKTTQLECRRNFTRAFGCVYEDLKVSPAEFNLLRTRDCQAFFARAQSNGVYIVKPMESHNGRGIRIMEGPTLLAKEFGQCSHPQPFIVADYIQDPVTIDHGYKYDFRVYLLVASINPLLAFFHDGFAHKADTLYSRNFSNPNIHITNADSQDLARNFVPMSDMKNSLELEMEFPRPFYYTHIRPRAMAIVRFSLEAALHEAPLSHAPGRFHLFAYDMIITKRGKLWLLEGNTGPGMAWFRRKPGLIPDGLYKPMFKLVLAIQTNPLELGTTKITVKDKFKYAGWELIYNELEEKHNGNVYNPCREMAD